jgi:SAM-dependent methyltransferase
LTIDAAASMADLLGRADPALARLAGLADLPTTGVALALGGDPVATVRALTDRRPGWWGVGVVGRHRPLPRTASGAARGDVVALPLRSRCVDGVFADHVPERRSDAVRVAQELARVCRPSGRIVVVLDGRDHQAELWRLVSEVAAVDASATSRRLTFEDVVEGALGPTIEVVSAQLHRDEVVATAAGPIMTAVQLLRPRVEPRLRGFVNWTTVLARSREAVTRALDEDPTWRTTRATGVVVGRPRPDHVGPG